MQRYFVDQALPAHRRLNLPDDVSHHLITVMRPRPAPKSNWFWPTTTPT